MKIRYVLGFAFNHGRTHVLLQKKKSKYSIFENYNGIGGKIENRETVLEAMTREFFLATKIKTDPSGWNKICVIYGEDWMCHVFSNYIQHKDSLYNLCGKDDNGLILPTVENVNSLDLEHSVAWLIPMCLDDNIVYGATKVRQ